MFNFDGYIYIYIYIYVCMYVYQKANCFLLDFMNLLGRLYHYNHLPPPSSHFFLILFAFLVC